jgi:hypothetical protein
MSSSLRFRVGQLRQAVAGLALSAFCRPALTSPAEAGDATRNAVQTQMTAMRPRAHGLRYLPSYQMR